MFVAIGALLGALAVGSGAFGAHALKAVLSSDLMTVYQTAVDYQFIHSILLVLIGMLAHKKSVTSLTVAGWLVFVGILLFSGSLYILTLSSVRSFGMITPVGGVMLIAGWLSLMMYALRHHYKA